MIEKILTMLAPFLDCKKLASPHNITHGMKLVYGKRTKV